MWTAALFSIALASDPLALLHVDGSKPTSPLFLTRHACSSEDGVAESLAPAHASFTHFFAANGKNAVHHICAIDLDGDGGDEIATLFFDAKSGRSSIRIVSAPFALAEKKPKVAASTSKSDPALPALPDRIVALGRFSRNGSGKDHLVLSCRNSDGSQRVEIRDPPAGKKKPLGPPLLVLDVTPAVAGGELFAAFGLGVDEVPGDELVIARRSAGGCELTFFQVATEPVFVASSLAAKVTLPSDVVSVAPTRIGDAAKPGVVLVRSTGEGPRIETRTVANLVLSEPVLAGKSPYSSAGLVTAIATRLAPSTPPDTTNDGADWEMGVGVGPNVLAAIHVTRLDLPTGTRFVDDLGASIDVVVTSVAIDFFGIAITPAVFTLKSKPVDSATATLTTVKVTNPSGTGIGGFLAGGYPLVYSATVGTLGTVYVPSVGGSKSFEWIGFRPASH